MSAGALLGQLGGGVIDRYGPGRLIVASNAVRAIAFALYPFVHEPWQMVLAVVAGNIALAALQRPTMALAAVPCYVCAFVALAARQLGDHQVEPLREQIGQRIGKPIALSQHPNGIGGRKPSQQMLDLGPLVNKTAPSQQLPLRQVPCTLGIDNGTFEVEYQGIEAHINNLRRTAQQGHFVPCGMLPREQADSPLWVPNTGHCSPHPVRYG